MTSACVRLAKKGIAMSTASQNLASSDALFKECGRAILRTRQTPAHARAGQIWVPPSRSLATRKISMRSKASCRGTLINVRTRREIHFESILERDAYYIMMADPQVTLIHDQPPPVEYEAANGKLRQHWFDTLIERRNGLRIAIDIKPKGMVEKSGILEVHQRILLQKRHFGAHVIALRTQQQISRPRAKNAQYIVWGLSNSTLSDRAIARLALENIGGRATIGEVVLQCGGTPIFRAAVVALLGTGEAKVDQEQKINDYSIIVLNPASSNEGGLAQ